ncbi:MAG: DnaJ domain-containing protein [Marmoricola sp.]
MTPSPNPSWYDVLGVSREATSDEIKAAWRDSTDKFEPGSGSGQFRMFNEAADVLLDPASRAAYDESLPAQMLVRPTVDVDPTPPPPPPIEYAGVEAEPVGEKRAHYPASRLFAILTLTLALLTIVALVAAGYFGLKVRSDSRAADARDEAPASAERAAKALLSYDYRNLPSDRKRASAYLTDGFRTKYLKNFSLLEKQKDGTPGAAIQTKTVVTSSVLGSGVMDAEDRVVRVLVYVNQVSKKPGVDPQIFQNRVAMTMHKDGNRWLVDDLKSY